MSSRWWIYQKSRFPIFVHGPLVLLFVASVMLFSSLQANVTPDLLRLIAAFISVLLFFAQLRIADEHKDEEVDRKYRPYRPVPSGLVSLDELSRLAWLAAALQFLVALAIDVGLVPILLAVWFYIALMTREFFAADWLKRRPAVYLLSHMLVMPLIAFYVSAFDWLCESRDIPEGLAWVLALSFGCGIVLEVGRKIRAPGQERAGVETYSAAWGGTMAIRVWAIAVAIASATCWMAVRVLSDTAWMLPAMALLIMLAALVAAYYRASGGCATAARLVEPVSGVIALGLYAALGPAQWFLA